MSLRVSSSLPEAKQSSDITLWQAWELTHLREHRNFLSSSSVFWDLDRWRKQTTYFLQLFVSLTLRKHFHVWPVTLLLNHVNTTAMCQCEVVRRVMHLQEMWTPSALLSLPRADNGAEVRGEEMKVREPQESLKVNSCRLNDSPVTSTT